jgi:arylsulfatase A-like enzyme
VTNKVPLIFHFPNDQYAGILTENSQNIDIAPTILDYLGISKPAWMEGSSILGKPDANRLVIAGITDKIESEKYALSENALVPPFYQFSHLSVVQCQNWYIFNLDDMTVREGKVANYVDPCSTGILDAPEVIREKVGNTLKQLGYDLPPNW